jgi:hypothetical protein
MLIPSIRRLMLSGLGLAQAWYHELQRSFGIEACEGY